MDSEELVEMVARELCRRVIGVDIADRDALADCVEASWEAYTTDARAAVRIVVEECAKVIGSEMCGAFELIGDDLCTKLRALAPDTEEK